MSHIKKLPSGRFKARWNDPDTGKDRAKTFDSKRAAQSHLLTIDTAIRDGQYVDASRGKITLGEFAQQWFAEQRASTSRTAIFDNAVRVHIVPMLGNKPLAKIEKRHVQEFVDATRAKLMGSSTRNIVEVLSQIFDDACHKRLIARPPIDARSKATKIHISSDEVVIERWPTTEEIARLIEASAEELKPMVVMLANTGMRIGELLGLQVRAINLKKKRLRVDQQRLQDGSIGPTKSRRMREVPLPVSAVEVLQELMEGKTAEGFLWVNSFGEPIRYRAFRYLWDRAVKDANLGWKPSPHDLRHHYASYLLSEGVDIVRVSRFLGHANATKTLKVYSHVLREDHGDVTAILDSANLGTKARGAV
jgi:integrase